MCIYFNSKSVKLTQRNNISEHRFEIVFRNSELHFTQCFLLHYFSFSFQQFKHKSKLF